MSSRNGSALLTVLWLTAALSAIGIAVASQVRGETERASTHRDETKSYFIAQGAITRAAMRMSWGPDYYKFGQPSMELPFPTGDAHVDIVPETAKLPLNGATAEELQRLLLALGVPEESANDIAAAIVDWRTPVLQDTEGPFDAFYLGQSPSFRARHASFIENEELLLIKGITPELFYGTSLDGSQAGLRDCVSVHGSAALDVNTARAETLIAAGLEPEEAQEIVRIRSSHPILTYDELGSIQQRTGQAGARLRIGGNTMFTLRATARLRQPDGRLSDLRRTVAALIKFYRPGNKENKLPGFVVVRWYDRI